jgi:Fibronectin type III domain
VANAQKDVSATGVLKIIVNLISQDQVNNTSRIQVIGQMINNGSVASYHLTADIGRSVGGAVYDDLPHFSFNIGAGVTYDFINQTFTVLHAADGTLTVTFSVGYGNTGTATFGNNQTVSVTTGITRIPKRPSNPHTPNYSNVTGTSLTISWGKSDDDGGLPIQYYTVRTSLTSSFSSYTDNEQNNTSRVLSGLTPGTTYWHRVYAYNGAVDGGGYSAYSENHAVMPSTPGGTGTTGSPSGMSAPALSNVTSTSLTVSWSGPTSDGGSAVDYYILTQWDNVAGTGTPTTYTVYGTSQDVTGLTPGSGYRFSVQAHNSVGLSATSPSATVTLTSSPTAPSAPIFSAKRPTTVTVTWSAPTNTGGSTITGYTLRRYDGTDTSGSYVDTTVSGTSTNVAGLVPGNNYTFVVYAQNGSDDNGGLSDASPSSTIQMLAGAKIRVDGVWVTAVPYIRNGGVWQLAVPYVRANGVWKLTD